MTSNLPRLVLSALTSFALLLAWPVPAVAGPTPQSASAVYVQTCGIRLCLGGSTFPFFGASVLAGPDDPASSVAQARAAHLNVIRVVSFLHEEQDPTSAPYDEERWQRVDRMIAAARQAGLKVELDLTTYRNLLIAHHINAYTYDWRPFIRFVTHRVNTVSRETYGSDPTIALVAFAAEVEPPGSPDVPVNYTTAQITGFFARTLAQWRAQDRHHLLTTGGLLHLDYDTGIDWRSIMRLPVVSVAAIHVYSVGDERVTVPQVSAFAIALKKPWITEEFGNERGLGDAVRARWFAQMYELQSRYHSAGVAFWNLGIQTVSPTYDVNTSTPLTLAVVRSQRPVTVPLRRWLRRAHRQRH